MTRFAPGDRIVQHPAGSVAGAQISRGRGRRRQSNGSPSRSEDSAGTEGSAGYPEYAQRPPAARSRTIHHGSLRRCGLIEGPSVHVRPSR